MKVRLQASNSVFLQYTTLLDLMIENKITFVEALTVVLKEKKRIVITSHTNPDGDALGSSLALQQILHRLGYQADIVIANSYPGFLFWMPNICSIVIHDKNPDKAKNLIDSAEIIFCLDYNALHRSGSISQLLIQSKAFFVLIDHHQEPELGSFQLSYSNVLISSTSELVYEILELLGATSLINKHIAECLFTGIMTDTGSFRHGVANSSTFKAVACLIDQGLDAARVHDLVYNSMTEDRLRLLGFSISERMQLFPEFHTAIIALDKNDLQRFHFQIGDTEGIVNFPLSIDSIHLAILITERKDHIHLSLRSKGDFSVNDMARKYFNGGGHINAAGGKTFTTVLKTVEELIRVLPEYKKQLQSEGEV
ncbi:MAG: DHH family phosphoesterase [Bacteroidales bacterium]